MAATRLIMLYVNTGKSVAQCLVDCIEYSQNAKKTKDVALSELMDAMPRLLIKNFFSPNRSRTVLPAGKKSVV